MCSDAANCCFEVGVSVLNENAHQWGFPPPPNIPSGYMMYTHWVSAEICVLLLKKRTASFTLCKSGGWALGNWACVWLWLMGPLLG